MLGIFSCVYEQVRFPSQIFLKVYIFFQIPHVPPGPASAPHAPALRAAFVCLLAGPG